MARASSRASARRLLAVQPGQPLGADPRGRAGIAFAVLQFRSHQAKPDRRVAVADAARGFIAFGPLQRGAGSRQVTRPKPDSGELPADVGQVSPRA